MYMYICYIGSRSVARAVLKQLDAIGITEAGPNGYIYIYMHTHIYYVVYVYICSVYVYVLCL